MTYPQSIQTLTLYLICQNLTAMYLPTQKGLTIRAMLDQGIYDTGIKVSDAEFNSISLHKRRFYGDWNYQISPKLPP
jgi:hypothetical protein